MGAACNHCSFDLGKMGHIFTSYVLFLSFLKAPYVDFTALLLFLLISSIREIKHLGFDV